MTKKPASKKPLSKPAHKPPTTSAASAIDQNQYLLYGAMAILFLITIMVYSPMVKNDFIHTWDDSIYVVDNKLLHDLSLNGIKNMFIYGDDFQKLINNYHPLTILSLALNYQTSGLSPASYHITNMVFHGLNAILAFLFAFLLSRRKLWPAVITGLFFAIHPMHIESVAWASERKDVLYTFFFLAGLIAYLKYLADEKLWKLGVALLFFIFSCLSKAMAVPFPMILLLIDFLLRRKFSWKMVVEKIPFFIIALLIGFMSVHLQSISAINKFETFTLFQRIMHASYGFITYILMFFNPSGLSAFYPYPAITTSGVLPLPFRIAPYFFMMIAAIIIWLSTRKGEIVRIIVFGILFYFFTIALVLQFLSVGKAIMADRYTYIPFIGVSFILGMLIDYFIRKRAPARYIGIGLAAGLLILAVVFSFISRERVKIWKNDITLWTDVLNQYPDVRTNFIYEKRAERYLLKDQYEAALADYQTIVANDARNENALEAIGRIYGKYYNDMGKAIENLDKAYAVNPKNPSVLKSLGVAMGIRGDFHKSLDYLLQAYQVDKADTTLARNISTTYSNLGMLEKAKEFDQLARSITVK